MIQATNDIGIWMDHFNAYLTKFTIEPMTTQKISSPFTHYDKVTSLAKSEILSHHKEQHEQIAYYKTISEHILKAERVLLFGPTDAKKELSNLLRANHLFDKISIHVENTDKMDEREQQLFITKYFSTK